MAKGSQECGEGMVHNAQKAFSGLKLPTWFPLTGGTPRLGAVPPCLVRGPARQKVAAFGLHKNVIDHVIVTCT